MIGSLQIFKCPVYDLPFLPQSWKWKMRSWKMCFVSKWAVFRFHDYGGKGNRKSIGLLVHKNPWTCNLGFWGTKTSPGDHVLSNLAVCFLLLLKLRSETGKNSTVEQWWFHHVKISSCLFLMVGSNINCWTPWLKTKKNVEKQMCPSKMCGPSRVFQKTTIGPFDELTKTILKQNMWNKPPKTPCQESFISGSSVLESKKQNSDPPGPGFFCQRSMGRFTLDRYYTPEICNACPLKRNHAASKGSRSLPTMGHVNFLGGVL